MQLFDGKTEAKELEIKIKSSLSTSTNAEKVFAIIRVGDNSGSKKYAELKKKFCDFIGINAVIYEINEYTPDIEIINDIKAIINNERTGGVIIQMPLPRLSLKSVLNEIPLSKDSDLLSSKSIERYDSGDFTIMPPVVRAYDHFIKHYDIHLQNKTAIIIGYGALVGHPISVYLSRHGAKVTVLDNYKTGDNLKSDLLILSAGVPNLVNGNDVSSGCAVVDFGYNSVDGKTVGDFNLKSDMDHLSFLSPSPGGMGPLDVRFLLMNFLGI
jgi:methylenetetrahydrofolate dehydrogenase (NADP+) / methenyltetrahydrofolate cyclohydrolase